MIINDKELIEKMERLIAIQEQQSKMVDKLIKVCEIMGVRITNLNNKITKLNYRVEIIETFDMIKRIWNNDLGKED